MTDPNDSERRSFWRSLPGLLTGVAGLITAVGGLIAALNVAGFIGSSDPVTTTAPAATTSLPSTQPENGQTSPTALAMESTAETTATTGAPQPRPSETDDTDLPEGPTSEAPTVIGSVAVPTEFLLGLAVGEDALWVTTDESRLIRIDPVNGNVIGEVPVGRFPLKVTVGAGSVWVANADDGTVSRVDPNTLAVTDTYVVGSWPTSLAVGAGAAWTVGGQSVFRLDLDTGDVTDIDVGVEAHCVAVGADAAWVCAPDQRSVLRVDLADFTVSDIITVGSYPRNIALGHDAVWVADEGGALARIDLRDLGVRQIAVGEFPQLVEVGQDAVWVLGTTLDRVDPETMSVTSIPVDGGQGMAVGLGSVWIGSGTAVQELG